MTTLTIGDKAPDFELKNQNGELIKLTDYEGKKVVLFFYPKASTPGCTNEACNLSDNYELFLAEGYDVLGISADSEKRQQNFSTKNKLPFSILSDEEKEVIKAYGVWGPKTFMGRTYDGIHRTTFIINENGLIEEIFSKVKTKEHSEQILNK